MNKHLSFNDFLKNEEETYFTGMSKIGINKNDYKYFPQTSSFFSLGQVPVNIGCYTILDFKKNNDGEITHAKVKQIRDPQFKSIKYDKENREKIDQYSGSEVFLVPIEDLEKLLLQGQTQQPQPTSADGPMSGGGVDGGGIV